MVYISLLSRIVPRYISSRVYDSNSDSPSDKLGEFTSDDIGDYQEYAELNLIPLEELCELHT